MAPAGWVSVKVCAPSLFVFVGKPHFTGPLGPSKVIVNNHTIYKGSTVLKDVSHETRKIDGRATKVVVNHGPSVGMVEKATGKSVKAVPIREAAARTRVPSEMAHGNKSVGEKTSKEHSKDSAGGGHQETKEARVADRDSAKPDHSMGRSGGWDGGGNGGFAGGAGRGGGGGGGRGKGK